MLEAVHRYCNYCHSQNSLMNQVSITAENCNGSFKTWKMSTFAWPNDTCSRPSGAQRLIKTPFDRITRASTRLSKFTRPETVPRRGNFYFESKLRGFQTAINFCNVSTNRYLKKKKKREQPVRNFRNLWRGSYENAVSSFPRLLVILVIVNSQGKSFPRANFYRYHAKSPPLSRYTTRFSLSTVEF